MRTREQEVEPLINLSEITEVELLILKRMREFTIGEHSSMFHGTGFDFVGLRDWQAGDRFENIDWPQSSLNNFSPLVVREFEQPTTSSVIMVADRSASTRCGANAGSVERPRPADRDADRARDRHRRHVGGVLPGFDRPDHLRRRLSRSSARCARASARAR